MDAVELDRRETLLAMYRSVDRMNHHLANDNNDGAESEAYLQRNLRSNFEELHVRSGWLPQEAG